MGLFSVNKGRNLLVEEHQSILSALAGAVGRVGLDDRQFGNQRQFGRGTLVKYCLGAVSLRDGLALRMVVVCRLRCCWRLTLVCALLKD